MKSSVIGFIIMVFFFINTNAQLTITTDSVIQISPCAGSNVLIPFTVSGGALNFGNVFTAELSDNLGNFTNPVPIGTLTYWNSGMIIGTIPINTTISIFYKIRVVASDPAVTGTESPNNVIVSNIAQLSSIFAIPNDSVCQGDTVTLSVAPNDSYNWSTGDTTQSISVTQPGSYDVTVVDFAGCETVADSVSVFYFPAPQNPVITLVNDTLFSSTANAYQWYLDNVIITGATNQWYIPVASGTYNVVITDTNGCTAMSDNFIFTSTNTPESRNYINIFPNPNSGSFNVMNYTKQKIKSIVLTDMLGKQLILTNNINSEQYSCNLRNINKGIYLLHIYFDDKKIVKKIIIRAR